MATIELNTVERQLQEALITGEYELAQRLLAEKESNIRPIYRFIFKASIAFAENDAEQVWKNIAEGLKTDGRNYELYMMLGDYYAGQNLQQAYLCYENAYFYCDVEEDRTQIREILDNLEKQGISVSKAAIVILSYNLLDMTRDCIESIRKTTPDSAREIIVVDNASKDNSVAWLKQQKDIKLLCNKENCGFPMGCNQGIRMAEKESDIMLLNNDTIMTPNALFWLRMGLYENDQVGSTGSVSNYVANGQAVIENGKTEGEYLTFAAKNNVPMETPYVHKASLVGFALLLKRCVLEKTGYLDERFSPGNFEDNDICLRIILSGYRNVLCKNSFIIHWGSKSFGKVPQKYNTLLETNQKKFFDKWKLLDLTSENYLEIRMDLLDIMTKYHAQSSTNIMTVGMGCGTTLSYLQARFPHDQIFAIEQQPYLAQISNQIVDTVCANLDEWKGDDLAGAFDMILVNETLEFTKNPETVLKELVKMLKQDGKLLIGFFNRAFYERIDENIGQDILFDRNSMQKLLANVKMTVDDWMGIQPLEIPEQEQKRIQKVAAQNPMLRQDDFVAMQWICIAERQRDDIKFGDKMVVCMPTCGHPNVIEDVLQHCAEVYKRYALDVYFYDSSKDEETKKVIENYQAKGYDNLYYVAVDPEMPVIDKFENIYLLKGIQKKYKYMWYLRERCWCEEKTLKLMYQAVCEDYDLVFMDVGHPESKEEISICNNANEFYHRCGDYATSMDTAIYNVDTMLGNQFDLAEFHGKYCLNQRRGFLFFLVILEQLSKKIPPTICLLAGNQVTIYHSVLGHSSWGDRRIWIWGKNWIGANEKLPVCYKNKEEVIKRTASLPWILGDKDGLIELHRKGILTPEYYEEIKIFWEQVSDIPLVVLKKIAYGIN